jgi:hypothetical protein
VDSPPESDTRLWCSGKGRDMTAELVNVDNFVRAETHRMMGARNAMLEG